MEEQKKRGRKPKPQEDEVEVQTVEETTTENTEKDINEQQTKTIKIMSEKEEFNPLRKERVIVSFILRERGGITDPKSPAFGNMVESASNKFVVPRADNGELVKVLNEDEQAFFEKYFNLPEGSMNPNRINDNYWTTQRAGYINFVKLGKMATYLDLSNATDYIRWKILLANKDIVCPSLTALEDNNKRTYRYVIKNESQEARVAGQKVDIKLDAYKLFDYYKDDAQMLRAILFIFNKKKINPNTKLEIIKSQFAKFIDTNVKELYQIMSSKNLEQKKVIIIATEKGLISERDGMYYNKENGRKLCEDYEEPKLNNAANYLASPEHADLLFDLQKKIQ